MESGPSDEVILRPAHPYTRLLASAAPDPAGRPAAATPAAATPAAASRDRLDDRTDGRLDGRDAVPEGGCLFRTRCPHAMSVYRQPVPVFPVSPGQTARCWLYQPDPAEEGYQRGPR